MLARLRSLFRRRRGALALAALGGGLYAVGFCGCDQLYLAWFCLVPVLWALDDHSLSSREALLIAWTFGLVAHMGVYTWIVGWAEKFGHLPLPVALLLYVSLCLGQGSLLGAWGWALNRMVVRLDVPVVWAAPVLMVVAEWLYPALFPSYLANSQYRFITFIQSLDIWGPLGLTFILALASSTLYGTLARLRGRRGRAPALGWAVLLGLCACNFLYGVAAILDADDSVAHSDHHLKVGLVQANMGIYEKHQQPAEGLRRHREQSLELERQGVGLVVWPESGYNYTIREGTENVAAAVLGPLSTPLIFGGLRVDHDKEHGRQIFNSAFLTDGLGNIQGTYDKTYLLAFGEYLPFGDLLPWLYELSPYTAKFTPGAHTKALVLGELRLGVLICYEDILPRFVRRVMASEPQPNLLVNLTNDAWFGDSREPRIHLALAAFRAVEHRRFLLRSTNTGISAVVDPSGRIVQETAVFARANLVADVAALQGRTLYGRLGDWPGWACASLALWWARAPLRRLLSSVLRCLRRGKAR